MNLAREDILPTLSAELSVPVDSDEDKDKPEEPEEGSLEEEMPTLLEEYYHTTNALGIDVGLAEYYHTTNALGIDVGEGSNDSDISMEVNTSRSSPLPRDDYVELLNEIDGILQSDDDNFVIPANQQSMVSSINSNLYVIISRLLLKPNRTILMMVKFSWMVTSDPEIRLSRYRDGSYAQPFIMWMRKV